MRGKALTSSFCKVEIIWINCKANASKNTGLSVSSKVIILKTACS